MLFLNKIGNIIYKKKMKNRKGFLMIGKMPPVLAKLGVQEML